jgi:thiol-disulfide isomerase/thioredoxin
VLNPKTEQMKTPYFKMLLVALMLMFCKQASAFTLIIKGDAKVKNLVFFPHLTTFPVKLVAGNNEIQFDSYPNAGYLMLKTPLKSSGQWRYLPMIWVPSDSSSIEITIDTDYNVVFSEESEYQIELNRIVEASNKQSLFPYEPSMDRPLEPILVLEAKSIIQNLKTYTDRSVLVNLLELSKLRNIDNSSTGVIAAYLKEPSDQIYANGKLIKIFGLDSLEKSVQVGLNTKKFMLLHVSGSWCGPCVKGIPDLRKSYDELSNEVEFVSLWNDPRLSTFKYLHQDKKRLIAWTSVWDKYGLMANALHVSSYPTYILFDKNGMEVSRWEGKLPRNLEGALSN